MGLCVVLGLLPGAAAAADGDLDPSFGTGGIVTTDFGSRDVASSIVLQKDGKFVVGGDSGLNNFTDFAVARYLTDGTLDPTFDTDGKVTTDVGSFDRLLALALQGDGKIVTAGTGHERSEFAVVRYESDGGLDLTFDDDGMVTTDFGSPPGFLEQAEALAIQADGKIVVAGTAKLDDDSGDFAIARYNPDGSLDPGFGTGGRVTTDFGDTDVVRAVVLQRDGRILVGGGVSVAGPFDFGIARYQTDGSLDPSFDSDGKLLVDFGGSEILSDMAIQSDGKIVGIGGTLGSATLVRLNVDGSLDAQGLDPYIDAPFGIGGKVVDSNAAGSLSLAVDGKLVAASGSNATPSGTLGFAVARRNIDGSLDPSFGIGGQVVTDITSTLDAASGVVITRDGEVVAAGTANIGSSTANFALVRYLVGPCCTAAGKPPGGGAVSGPGRGKPSPPRPGLPRPGSPALTRLA